MYDYSLRQSIFFAGQGGELGRARISRRWEEWKINNRNRPYRLSRAAMAATHSISFPTLLLPTFLPRRGGVSTLVRSALEISLFVRLPLACARGRPDRASLSLSRGARARARGRMNICIHA